MRRTRGRDFDGPAIFSERPALLDFEDLAAPARESREVSISAPRRVGA